jgi:hypothetical protein
VRTLALISVLSATLLTSTYGSAHIELDDPPKRDAAMKTRPCGGSGARSATPKTFAPGQTITIKWHETVVHPGFFRIALSTDGVTFPADPPDPPPAASGAVLAIIPKVSGVTEYSADITLPAAPCATCTIQVIQYMQQHAPPPYYYQCADITTAGGPSGAADASAGGASGEADAAGGNQAPANGPSEDDGGCTLVPSKRTASPSPWWLAALGAALAARAARRRARVLDQGDV